MIRLTFRLSFLISVGLFLFLLGVVYLQTDGRRVERLYRVYGENISPHGGSAAFRMTAFDREAKKELSVQLVDVGLRRVVGPFQPRPLLASSEVKSADFVVDLPPLESGDTLVVRVAGPAGVRTLEIPLTGLEVSEAPVPPARRPLQGSVGVLHDVAVVPEGGRCVAGMENRILFRVTDAAGQPSGDTEVVIYRAAAELVARVKTDRLGLAVVPASFGAASKSWTVHVMDSEGGQSRHAFKLVPLWTKTRIHPSGVVVSGDGGRQVEFEITSFHEDERLLCDLREGGALRWMTTQRLRDGKARAEIPIEGGGPYVFQCSYHASQPGHAGAAVIVVVSKEGSLDYWRLHLGNEEIEEPYLAALDAELGADSPEGRRLLHWVSSLLPPEVMPTPVLLDTSVIDQEEMDRAVTGTRRWLLVLLALGFIAMLVWMLAAVWIHHRAMRKSYTLYQEEGGEDVEDLLDHRGAPLRSFGRDRGNLQVIAIGTIVVLNIAAIITLLYVIFRS